MCIRSIRAKQVREKWRGRRDDAKLEENGVKRMLGRHYRGERKVTKKIMQSGEEERIRQIRVKPNPWNRSPTRTISPVQLRRSSLQHSRPKTRTCNQDSPAAWWLMMYELWCMMTYVNYMMYELWFMIPYMNYMMMYELWCMMMYDDVRELHDDIWCTWCAWCIQWHNDDYDVHDVWHLP